MIEGITHLHVVPMWPIVEPILRRAVEVRDSGYTTDDLLTEIIQRRKQLWFIDRRAVGVTSIVTLPQWKKFVVEYLSGDGMKEWADEWFLLTESFARFHQCKYIEVEGREGWARLAKSRGDATCSYTVSRKTL